ncbi:hypothetical protein HKX48_006187 [Thoreauomyces humboldtii]|nr:hypothetical protein HKX48_006187 [Thoreauomyces humboldtii]
MDDKADEAIRNSDSALSASEPPSVSRAASASNLLPQYSAPINQQAETIALRHSGDGRVVPAEENEPPILAGASPPEHEEDSDDEASRKHVYPAWLRTLEAKLRLRPAVIQPMPVMTRPMLPGFSRRLAGVFKRVPCRWRWAVRCFYVLLWIIVAGLLISFNNYKAMTAEGQPTYLACNDELWEWQVETCGLNGVYCSPFANQSFVVRCPQECLQTRNLNQRWLGNTTQGFLAPWVVGSGPYRAESWICAAGIHAGVIKKHWGGCAAIDIVGEISNFESTTANGITTLPFPSWFPKAYNIRAISSSHCTDFSWGILPVAYLFSVFFSLFWPTKGSFIFALVSAGFWYGTFIAIPIHGDSWTSAAFGTYFVTLGYTYVLYTLFMRPSILYPARFPLDTAILYIAPFYLALHMEILTAPLSNFGLTSRAFRDPETLVIFVIGLPAVLIVCSAQLWLFRRHGMLVRYILAYGTAAIIYFVVAKIVGLSVHLHHYTLGIILLPLTRLQSRTSLVMQGFLIGLVVQGISRWGPASPFDTAFQNQAGDEVVSVPRPSFAISPNALAANGTIAWEYGSSPGDPIPSGLSYDAFSLLLNDVEIYRGVEPSYNVQKLLTDPLRDYYVRVSLVSSGSALQYCYPVVVTGSGKIVYQNGTIVTKD